MTQNVEELEESLQQGLNALLENARTAEKLPLCKAERMTIQLGVSNVVDALADPEMAEEDCAVLILRETQTCEKIIRKNLPVIDRILRWFSTPFQPEAREQKKDNKILKIAKSQGIEGLKILKQKIRWEAGKAKRPMDFAKLTLLEEKIQIQINQLNTP